MKYINLKLNKVLALTMAMMFGFGGLNANADIDLHLSDSSVISVTTTPTDAMYVLICDPNFQGGYLAGQPHERQSALMFTLSSSSLGIGTVQSSVEILKLPSTWSTVLAAIGAGLTVVKTVLLPSGNFLQGPTTETPNQSVAATPFPGLAPQAKFCTGGYIARF